MAIKTNIRIFFIFVIAFLIFIGCSTVSVESDNEPTISFAISKPRNSVPDDVAIVLKGVNENSHFDSIHQGWSPDPKENRAQFHDLQPGEYDVSVYGKKGGFTILEGSNQVFVNPGEQASVEINLNSLLRVIPVDFSQEDQFLANNTTESPFWSSIPEDGAANFGIGDNLNVSVRAAWGGNYGLYLYFKVKDVLFNALGNNIDFDTDEWRSDALVVYLSTGQSVNDIENDMQNNFFNNHIRLMVEVGNGTIGDSKVKIQKFNNKITLQFEEENTIQNINSNNFQIKMFEVAGNRIVVVRIKKDLFTEANFSNQPKIGATFRYRSMDGINAFTVIGWKNNSNDNLTDNINGWGNLKLVGP